jgi:hypothetical protein
MVRLKHNKSKEVVVRLKRDRWSRYLLASNPRVLREHFEANDAPYDSAKTFLAACEAEARNILKKYPLPPEPQGYVRTDPSHIRYLSDFGNIELLSEVQLNAVEVLRLTFTLNCLIDRAPWEDQHFQNRDAGALVLNTMALTAALLRGNFFETLWPKSLRGDPQPGRT